MPEAEPYRAWATFSFTAQSGRVNECDLLVAVPAGLFLVEIKSHPGELRNTGSTWNFRGDDRVRTINNPLHFNDLKSKELRSQLQWAARKLYRGDRMVPRIEPAVFLSAPDLVSHLDEVQRIRVYGRDDGASGLARIWQDFLGLPPDRPDRGSRRSCPGTSFPNCSRPSASGSPPAICASATPGRWSRTPSTRERRGRTVSPGGTTVSPRRRVVSVSTWSARARPTRTESPRSAPPAASTRYCRASPTGASSTPSNCASMRAVRRSSSATGTPTCAWTSTWTLTAADSPPRSASTSSASSPKPSATPTAAPSTTVRWRPVPCTCPSAARARIPNCASPTGRPRPATSTATPRSSGR